ncbi:hypothetical protein [Tardiphaga sp.]|uniref:hypothetical protein n=1 Tax=Tardiphaga sp. TaxID=1926292 RepID=UPI00352B3C1F
MTKSKGMGRGGVRKGAGRKPAAAKVDWDAVARDYFTGTEDMEELLERHGLSYGALMAYATANQWIRRPRKRLDDDIGDMASELAVVFWAIDGALNRARRFVAAMTALGVSAENIAPHLGISERSLKQDFARELQVYS